MIREADEITPKKPSDRKKLNLNINLPRPVDELRPPFLACESPH